MNWKDFFACFKKNSAAIEKIPPLPKQNPTEIAVREVALSSSVPQPPVLISSSQALIVDHPKLTPKKILSASQSIEHKDKNISAHPFSPSAKKPRRFDSIPEIKKGGSFADASSASRISSFSEIPSSEMFSSVVNTSLILSPLPRRDLAVIEEKNSPESDLSPPQSHPVTAVRRFPFTADDIKKYQAQNSASDTTKTASLAAI